MNFTYDVSESDFSYEEEGVSYSDTSDRDETTEQEQYDSQSHDSDADDAHTNANLIVSANAVGAAELGGPPIALSSTAQPRLAQAANRNFPGFANSTRNPADGATSDTDTSSQIVESEDDRPAKRRCVAMDCGSASNAGPSTSRAPCSTSKVSPNDQPSSSKINSSPTQNEEAESCPICFEAWSNAGEHRLVSLRCGHLFGRSCIMRWLSNQGAKCPQCNRTAKKSDVRILYTKALRALDTSEREAAVRQLEEERERRKRAELDFAYVKLQFEFSQQECRRLRKELEDERRMRKFLLAGDAQSLAQAQITQQGAGSASSGSTGRNAALFRFVPFRTVRICQSGARVMAYTPQFATLVASQPSNNQLYPGFGFKKLSLLDLCAVAGSAPAPIVTPPGRVSNSYIAVHSKPIRDASFQPNISSRSSLTGAASTSYVLLSGSVDKTVKLTSFNSNTVIQTYQCEHPVWSVCWSLENANHFFAGLQNGALLLFDIRNTAHCVSHLNRLDLDNSSSMQHNATVNPSSSIVSTWRPTNVVSMHYVEQSSQFRASGLLVGHLDRLVFYERAPTGGCDYVPHLLPVEQRALSSLCLEPTTGHFLASFRPNARCPNVQHQLYVLEKRSLSSLTCTANTDATSSRRFPTGLVGPSVQQPTPASIAGTSASTGSGPTTSGGPFTAGSISVSSCNHIATHNAGQSMTFLARNRLFMNPARPNTLMACASDEQSESIHIWDASDSDSHDSQLQRIDATDGTVLDLLPITLPDAVGEQRSTTLGSRFFLAALTEKDVHLHQFVSYPNTV